MVMGIFEPADLPGGRLERTETLKNLIMDFCKMVKPNFDGWILYSGTCSRLLNGKMRIEFRLELEERGSNFRKTFAMDRSSKKLDPELMGYQVITLATRIRMDIMKAIAKRIELATESAYVPNFLSRPILHIKKKASSPTQVRSLTFVEAVCQFRGELEKGDLDIAYDKANGYFRGMMRQHFIVFADPDPASWSNPTGSRGPGTSGGTGGSGAARGTKRAGDHEGGGGGKKQSC